MKKQGRYTMTYALHVKHYYYSGTFYAPKDGLMQREDNDCNLTFPSIDEAIRWMEMNGMSPCSDNEWSVDGTYYTRHGEYERPTYSIHKLLARGWRPVGKVELAAAKEASGA